MAGKSLAIRKVDVSSFAFYVILAMSIDPEIPHTRLKRHSTAMLRGGA
jgi:hypothetical protein